MLIAECYPVQPSGLNNAPALHSSTLGARVVAVNTTDYVTTIFSVTIMCIISLKQNVQELHSVTFR